MKEKRKGINGSSRGCISKQKVFTKILSLVLAVLVTFFMIPSASYAAIIDTAAELGSGADGGADAIPSYHPTYENLPVAYEEYSMREESVKHFRLADGTYVAAQYPEPVHYLDDDGAWQDIDNRITESGSELTVLGGRIKFAKKITGNETLFTLHENGAKITMSLVGANKKTEGAVTSDHSTDGGEETELGKMLNLEYLNSSVLYEEILDGVDLEYVVSSLNVKENVIVKEKNAEGYSYSFELKLNNLTAELSSDGNVYIRRHTGDEAYVIPAPIVYDGEGTCAPDDAAAYTLESLGNGSYILTVTASSEWMNAEERVYPVTVDPTIGTPNRYVTDLYINSSHEYVSYNTLATLEVSNTKRAYWKIDALGLPYIPTTAHLVKAEIRLYGSGNACVGAYRVYENWGSNLRWYDTSSHVEVCDVVPAQGVIYGAPVDYLRPTEEKYHCWDITPLFKEWYEGSNYGVAFAPVEGSTGSATFRSSETTVADTAPRLCVTYVDVRGIEDYYSYASQSVGSTGSGNINLATGDLVYALSTLSTTDYLMPVAPALVYSSSYAKNFVKYGKYSNYAYSTSFMPYGFKLNVSETLVRESYVDGKGEDTTFYIYSDADGTEHYFTRAYDESGALIPNTYCDDSGLRLKLNDSNESLLTMETVDGTKRYFTKFSWDSAGSHDGWYMSSIEDTHGNAVEIDVDNEYRPIGISLRPNGSSKIQMLTLSYRNGVLSTVRNDATGEAIVIRYSSDGSGTLSSTAKRYIGEIIYAKVTEGVSNPDWDTFAATGASYGIERKYSSDYMYIDGRLIRVEDGMTGRYLVYTYTDGKVTKVSEYAKHSKTDNPAQTVHINYYNGYTEVMSSGEDDDINTTSDNIITRYTFDEYARVKSSYSTNYERTVIYGAVSGVYETQENIKNNVKESVTIGGSSSTYLLNGSFEKNTLSYWGTAGNVSIIPSRGEFMGELCVQLSSFAGLVSSVYQTVTLAPGEYTLSFKYLSREASDAVMYYGIRNSSTGADIAKKEGSLEAKYDGATLTASLTFVIPESSERTNAEVYVSFINNNTPNSSFAYLYIDEVVLAEGNSPADYNYVSVGNFDADAYDSHNIPANSDLGAWVAHSEDYGNGDTFTEHGIVMGRGWVIDSNITQVIYEADASTLSAFDSPDSSNPFVTNTLMSFSISGFGYSDYIVSSDVARFGLCATVYYYQGVGKPDVTREYFFPFEDSERQWQFVSGSFKARTVSESQDDTANYLCVRKIEVTCEYSGQLNGKYAYFDNIVVNSTKYEPLNRYVYDVHGNIAQYNGTSVSTYYEYDENNVHRLTRVANNRGELTDYVYDGDLLVREVNYKFTASGSIQSDNYPYGAADPDSLIDKTPKTVTIYEYNSYGQCVRVLTGAAGGGEQADSVSISGNAIISTSTYETAAGSKIFGALLSETSPEGITTSYTYDNKSGILTMSANADTGAGTAYTYDDLGRMTEVRPTKLQNGVISAVTAGAMVLYDYNEEGYLREIQSQSTPYYFTYDAYGNTDTISAGGNILADYDYNAHNGKLRKVTYGNGFAVRYVYNDVDNISEIWYTVNGSETKAYEYEYTTEGQLHSVTDVREGSVTVYTYDNDNRLAEWGEYSTEDYKNNFSSSLTYDDKSRISHQVYNINYCVGSTNNTAYSNYSYYYKADGKISYVSISGDGDTITNSYSYDELDRVLSITNSTSGGFYNKVTYGYATGSATRVNTYTSIAGTTTGGIVQYRYVYDDNGNIESIYRNNSIDAMYEYDGLGQLVREDNASLGRTYVYTYDDAGNILTKKVYSYTTATNLAGMSPIETKTYGYGNESWGDQLTSYNGAPITYDGIGNPLTYYNGTDYTFTWEGRRLKTATKGNQNFTFTYNDEGIRTSKTVNGVEHVYVLNGSQIISDSWGNNLIIYAYDAAGAPIGMRYLDTSNTGNTWQSYWFEKNLQGDITYVYDNTGTPLAAYTYDAWGNHTATYWNGGQNTVVASNPFRYRGYYYDTDLGLYYLNSRYYDSNIGRFISSDIHDVITATPMALTDKNLYAYCDNNPVMRVDNGGEFWFSAMLIGAVVGAAINASVSALSQAITKGTVNWAEVGVSAIAGAITGAVATTGLGALASGAINAAVDGIEYMVVQTMNDEEINRETLYATMIFSGITAGPGLNSSKLKGIYKNAKTGLKTAVSDRRIARLSGQISMVKHKIGKHGQDIAIDAGTSLLIDVFGPKVNDILYDIFG